MRPFWIAATAVALMAGCAAKRIPGTDIDDTPQTRALLGVMEKYRTAVEAEDADGVMALIDPEFQDNSGTATPSDDLDYKNLRRTLADRFARLDSVKLSFEVKRINIERDRATAIFSYSSSFKLPGMTQKPLGDSELEEMSFKRTDNQWRITSGI